MNSENRIHTSKNKLTMRRIVPNIFSNDLGKSKQFYTAFLGMQLAMEMDWILTFSSKENSTAQISILQHQEKNPVDNSSVFISIEVSDIDSLYEKAMEQKIEIVYPITNENWGVRRFFVKDPNGVTINLLTHLEC